ncbi:MAG: hypothetical protein ACLQF1_06850, partial [Methyloceanibacter sp.]|jgi:hypothetical protein
MRMMILTCAAGLLIGGVAQAAEKGVPLDGAKCQELWTLVSPNGATITKYKADPYVIDFGMVDTDSDGTIDANEFKAGCKGGWIKGQ